MNSSVRIGTDGSRSPSDRAGLESVFRPYQHVLAYRLRVDGTVPFDALVDLSPSIVVELL